VRLAHYQHDEHMARACDRSGLLAWAEIPVYWGIHFDDAETEQAARDQLAELIVRDRNRASVILWSVANETRPDEARTRFIAGLAYEARRLDPTRLVTAALFSFPDADGHWRIDDPLGEHLDVVGVNEYLGWYHGAFESFASATWSSAYDKPIVVSEFGADAVAGRHGDPESDRWCEEHQVRIYEHQLEMIERIPGIAGLSPWILKDFRSPRRQLHGIQDGFNRKGLVSDRGVRKAAFETLRQWYAAREQPTDGS
jgi:beta-glucuronidase